MKQRHRTGLPGIVGAVIGTIRGLVQFIILDSKCSRPGGKGRGVDKPGQGRSFM